MRGMGFLLLCGGASSRMGRCKALLMVNGEPLYLSVARAGRAFTERLLSVNDPAIPTPEGFARIPDLVPGCGPIGGLHAALSVCESPALIVAPCDAPFYSEALARHLAERFDPAWDALILTDPSGRSHPLLGVYAKSCLPAIARHMDAGDYKLARMLGDLRVCREAPPGALGESIFLNLNAPADLAALTNRDRA